MAKVNILKNINSKYLMVSKDKFIYNSDFLRGIYDRPRSIYEVLSDFEPNDFTELEIFLNSYNDEQS